MSRNENMFGRWAAIAGLAALAACAQPEVPTDKYYRLSVDSPAAGAATLFKGTIEVERFVADGLVAGRPIVYTEPGQSYRLQEYHYHFWTEPPTIMLRDQLIAYLRAARVADAVVIPEMRVEPDYILAGKVKRLEKVAGAAPKAVLHMELALRRASGGKLVFLDTYEAELDAENNSVDAAVMALNKALGQVYAKFLNDLRSR